MTRPLVKLQQELQHFTTFDARTEVRQIEIATTSGTLPLPCFTNEFWTARQRAAHSLHEISYRACFKPQLPRFFIERLTEPGERVYDPFMGRGTTLLEAALSGRVPIGCDINPLSRHLLAPRLQPPVYADLERRLDAIEFQSGETLPQELLVFYHPETLKQLLALRRYLRQREAEDRLDDIDHWLRMVAVNRLTGHSSGFFSVYTMPPNQAVSSAVQEKINRRRQQTPPPRDIPALILKKSRSLLKQLTAEQRLKLQQVAKTSCLLTAPAAETPKLADNSIALVVTSPPFLDVVDYAGDELAALLVLRY